MENNIKVIKETNLEGVFGKDTVVALKHLQFP